MVESTFFMERVVVKRALGVGQEARMLWSPADSYAKRWPLPRNISLLLYSCQLVPQPLPTVVLFLLHNPASRFQCLTQQPLLVMALGVWPPVLAGLTASNHQLLPSHLEQYDYLAKSDQTVSSHGDTQVLKISGCCMGLYKPGIMGGEPPTLFGFWRTGQNS